MNYTYSIIIISLCIWIPWLWRYIVKPHVETQRVLLKLSKLPHGKRYIATAEFLNQLYLNSGARQASHKDKQHFLIQDDNFTYGEINVLSFILILEQVKPQPGEVFFDLGCGAGKAVLTAALNFDFAHAVGIELLPSLYALANTQVQNAQTSIRSLNQDDANLFYKRLKCVEIIHSDFLNIDISHCDILFINATCLNDATWQSIVEKVLCLKPGSRIIVTTKTIHHDRIQLVHESKELMSWGMNSVRIYTT